MQLIIAGITHRCGSTLLQRICNAREKTLIWGEHLGIIKKFYEIYCFHQQYASTYEHLHKNYFNNKEDPNKVFIANLNPPPDYMETAIIASIRSYLKKVYSKYRNKHDIIGFKEVRYGENELNLLRKCYPEAKFLLLVRNPLAIWRSNPEKWRHPYADKQWDNPLQDFVKTWNKNAKFYFELNKSDSHAHLFRLEDIVRKTPSTIQLLTETAHISQENINYVLARKLGSTGKRKKEIPENDKKFILNHCREIMNLLKY